MTPPCFGLPLLWFASSYLSGGLHDQQLQAIDAWIDEIGEKISRPEAIRRLVELGLKGKAR